MTRCRPHASRRRPRGTLCSCRCDSPGRPPRSIGRRCEMRSEIRPGASRRMWPRAASTGYEGSRGECHEGTGGRSDDAGGHEELAGISCRIRIAGGRSRSNQGGRRRTCRQTSRPAGPGYDLRTRTYPRARGIDVFVQNGPTGGRTARSPSVRSSREASVARWKSQDGGPSGALTRCEPQRPRCTRHP